MADNSSPIAPVQPSDATGPESGSDEKSRKRDFFRFGRKDDDKKKSKAAAASNVASVDVGGPGFRPASPLGIGSPGRSPYLQQSSPRNMRSASPRTHSPASSMIFERNVQEDVVAPQSSSQIPSHIITENHIPPALDATADTITDGKLNPDTVEIVTSAVHQPAATTIADSLSDQPSTTGHLEDPHMHTSLPRLDSDNASNYASLDTTDVRRLSFISFADVVQAEHDLVNLDARRDSQMAGQAASYIPRSPSPLRSPASPNMPAVSPPTSSSAASPHETSPHRAMLGDLNIETMRQALRKTGSADLSAFRTTTAAPSSTVHDQVTSDPAK